MYADAHVEFIHHPEDEVEIDPQFISSQINPSFIDQAQPELLFLAVYVEPTANAWQKQLFIIDAYKKIAADHGWIIVQSKKDLAKPGIKVILHIEDLFSIGEDITRIKQLCQLGIRSIGLTHNHANQFSGGSLATEGLSPLGQTAIQTIIDAGMILDFAHLSEASVKAIVDKFHLPAFVSHTGIRSVFANPRNITNQVLQSIKETNGFVGLGLAGSFLGKQPITHRAYLNQINYAASIVGFDRVGIGSDLGGVISFLPSDLQSIKDLATLKKSLPAPVLGQNLLNFITERSTLR